MTQIPLSSGKGISHSLSTISVRLCFIKQILHSLHTRVMVWHSGNAMVSINEVAVSRTLGQVNTWMGDSLQTSKPCFYVTNHQGQLGPLSSVALKISTSSQDE